ncbi:MAG: hypothetical protein JWM37_784 [Candidatus Saccharibacteria bacterium]|nr:hypothetical protein [Candidatus Saccharibacteria bacterium]
MAERPPFSGSLERLAGTRAHRAIVEAMLQGIDEEESLAVEQLHGELSQHIGRIVTVVGKPVRLWRMDERLGREEYLTPSMVNGAVAQPDPDTFARHLFARLESYDEEPAMWLGTPERQMYRSGVIVPLTGIVSIELEPPLEEPRYS